jgi:hypothetical protein
LAASASAVPRSYLNLSGGADVLTTNLDGDVVNDRVVGHVELGIGTHLGDDLLMEGTFGVLGTQQQDTRPLPLNPNDPEDLNLPDHLRVYRVEVNPIMLRLRWARSGMRKGYMKPELSVGAGIYSVSRWLRPFPSVVPEVTSELLAAFEVGASALFVFGKNWMGYMGPRYTFTQRTDLVDETDHLDGLSLLLGFRFFLNSPRDEFEPPDS